MGGIVLPGQWIDLQCIEKSLHLGGIALQRTKAPEDVRGRRIDDIVALGVVDLLARTDQQILSALALVWSGLAHIDDGPLPHVIDEAGDGALRHVHDDRTRLGKIEEADDVGRRCICRKDATLAYEVVVNDDIARLGAEDVLMSLLPVGHANDR